MIKNEFKIAYADKSDAKKIIILVHEVIGISLKHVFPPSALDWFYDYHSIAHLEEEFDDGALVVLVYDENKIIGTVTYYAHELKRLFIHPKYQKAGLGKMFVNHIENVARKRNDKYIMLYASPASWGYYEKKGYQKICIAADEMSSGEYLAYCTMVKNLVTIDWSIDKAHAKDAEQILNGQRKAFLDIAKAHSHMDMPPMIETVNNVEQAIENCSVYVAKENGKVVGSVRGQEKDGACYISRLWVLPEYQGMGIGHALMFAAEDEFDRLDKYKLFTGSKSSSIIDFYKERGYVEAKRELCRNYELVYFEKMNAIDMLTIKKN